jgi:hypothetical protein
MQQMPQTDSVPTGFSLRIYSQDPVGGSSYEDYDQLPVSRPCVVVFHLNHEEARADAAELLHATRKLLGDIQASLTSKDSGDWHDLIDLEANRLHVVVCKGSHKVSLEPAVLLAADKSHNRTWILPVLNRADAHNVAGVLGEEVGKRNVAFWQESICELPLTLLARAGVTTLDRRAFISYRRNDTSPLADQLFDALTRRNFQVFLDRVSVDPGADFQAALFAQLSHKSLVVLLNSKNFPNSRWTMDEIRFARERRLSLIILRLPDAADNLGATASEELLLDDNDLMRVDVPGFSTQQAMLKPTALGELVERLIFQHDKELIGRLRDLKLRVLEAVEFAGAKASSRGGNTVKSIPSKHDSTVTVEIRDGNVRRYTIYPSAYPPDVPELYDAANSGRPIAEKRLVVGHVASMLPLRTSQLDWVVNGRNVGYHDIDAISLLLDLIQEGRL